MSDSLAFSFAVSLGLSMLGLDTVVGLMPQQKTEDFFQVHSVSAERVGQSAVLNVDRTIHRDLPMEYTVRIMAQMGSGWRQVCKAESNVFLYRAGAVLPDPVTLDWWTDGACRALPPGRVQIITTWKPDRRDLESVTAVAELGGIPAR